MTKQIYADLIELQAKVRDGKISTELAEAALTGLRNCSTMKSIPKNLAELLDTDLASRRDTKLHFLGISKTDTELKSNTCPENTLAENKK